MMEILADGWLRYCGAAGQLAVNGENKHQPVIEKNRSTYLNTT